MVFVPSFSRKQAFLNDRVSYAKIPQVVEVPNLIKNQLDSFHSFQQEGLRELLVELSPIQDITGTRLELTFLDPQGTVLERETCDKCGRSINYQEIYRCDAWRGRKVTCSPDCERNEWEQYDGGLGQPRYEFRRPKYSGQECRERDMTYASLLYVRAWLWIKETREWKEQELFLGDFPLMTSNGTFIINGAERVVVSQLIRSPGVYFTMEEDVASGRQLCFAKLIPDRGAWLEFETSSKNMLSVKINGKRKIPITTLLRAIGYGSDEQLQQLFQDDVDTSLEHPFIKTTMEREPLVRSESEALIDVYKRLRPGDPLNIDNARMLINNLFFNPRRYNLGKVGRYKLNKRLGLDLPLSQRTLTREDLVEIVRHIIMVNNGLDAPDDIDHLGNRRVRTVGKLIQNQFRLGLLRLERAVRERMTIINPEVAAPSSLVNNRPIVAAIREFFGGSQLSQFMDQTNPLAELTHKRRLSALGPGGLSRERAGFDVRDVHHSHYGRICPIETPEGPNIGLIGALATYGSIDEYGFIRTPYRTVIREVESNSEDLLDRTVWGTVFDEEGNQLLEAGSVVTPEIAPKLYCLPPRSIKVMPFVSHEIVSLPADEQENYTIAQASVRLDHRDQFIEKKVEVRRGNRYFKEASNEVDLVDVSPKQIVSVATSLIPFLEHDDANRALMGANMQRQAVPLLYPEAPLVATGMEKEVARYSGQVIFAQKEGVVTSVTGSRIVVQERDGEERGYPLMKFFRTNQGTCINLRPLVSKGDLVVSGQVLADGSATDRGELALGRNILCAFMSWEGYNFEDAVIISESLVKEDKFTSIHIEKHEVGAQHTKLGDEEITRDIPNVGEESLRDLDERGIIRIGAEVSAGDILVGKITPKGETELTAEQKLLRAIFGEKAREVKDTSLRVPHGEQGKVIAVKEISRDTRSELPAGVKELVRVWVAQKRKISVGDKMAGRHGNKGVVARILPVEDMPYLPDGRPLELILNPIGVPSRMNIGQVMETHLGWASHILGVRVLSPVFDGADGKAIEDALAEAWLSERGHDGKQMLEAEQGDVKRACLRLWLEDLGIASRKLNEEELGQLVEKTCRERGLAPPTSGKTILYDGRTGEPFDQPVTVGYLYMMKLIHLVEDKIHARSTGPYSLITQQPLGGKAQFGGQRFGEMEVWALEAYGAAHVLQELLTVKSDEVAGRAKSYEAIVKGEDLLQPGVPESFKVLVKELQSLGLSIEVLHEEKEKVILAKKEVIPSLGMEYIELEEREKEDV